MTTTIPDRPNTHQMVVGHRVFRREFRLLPELMREVEAGNTARSRVLAEHASDVTTALHVHHLSEDEVLWPRLLDRVSLHAELVHRMQQQHDQIGEYLERIRSLLPVWAETAAPRQRDELATTLADASVVVETHLDEEERQILPLVAAHLTIVEWDELAERMHASMPRARMLKFLGMVLEEATPEEQRQMMSALPLPARMLWVLLGRRKYQGVVRSVRGTRA